MELVFALDLMGGQVVHGRKGKRDTYQPLLWGPAPSANPIVFLQFFKPRHIYIADLDRIQGVSNHDRLVEACAAMVNRCYVDRGCRSPADFFPSNHIITIVGTETAGSDLSLYQGGYLSIDVKEGMVIPSGDSPENLLGAANELSFDGCILLNIGAVGTLEPSLYADLERWRSCYQGRLLYGGGVSGQGDLTMLKDLGYEGAILSTAVHKGAIPLTWMTEGFLC